MNAKLLLSLAACMAATPAFGGGAAPSVEYVQAAEHTRNMRASIQLMSELGAVLDEVEDRASADEAAPKVAAIAQVLHQLRQESAALGTPAPAIAAELRAMLPSYLMLSLQLAVLIETLQVNNYGSDALRTALQQAAPVTEFGAQ